MIILLDIDTLYCFYKCLFYLDYGICKKGLEVNSTGRLKGLQEYFQSADPPIAIQFTGIYNFSGCYQRKAKYKNRNSSFHVELYWSKFESWRVN